MLFTAENAAEMAKRSHLPTSARFKQPEPIAVLPQPAVEPADINRNRALERVRSQLDKIDDAIDGLGKDKEGKACKTDPRAWDALTRAKERLFRAWVHLAGIPGPGQLKPVTPRTPKHSQAEPIE